MRLIILHHDYTDLRDKDAYFIYSLIPHWERRGIEVKHWTGTRDLPEGDAVLVHVDLSVVPSRFLKAALRYPLAFNSRMEDIRKSALPGRSLCLAASSAFPGAVVVKTELNHGGIPEKLFFQKRRLSLPLVESWDLFRASRLVEPLTYPVYGPVKVGNDSAASESPHGPDSQTLGVKGADFQMTHGVFLTR